MSKKDEHKIIEKLSVIVVLIMVGVSVFIFWGSKWNSFIEEGARYTCEDGQTDIDTITAIINEDRIEQGKEPLLIVSSCKISKK